MKHKPISLRRRHLMAAGLASVAAPSVLASERGGDPHEAPAAGLILSGRILGADRSPLAGATIEAWRPDENGERATVITDGDGRFYAVIAPAQHSGRARHLHYRVSHQGLAAQPARRLQLARAPGVSGDRLAHLQRDETGAWRGSFGVTLA